jgi:hypothetical protein
MQAIEPIFVAIPAGTTAVAVELKDVWGTTLATWSIQVVPSASPTTVQVNATITGLPSANYALVAKASASSFVVTSAPVPVRVEAPAAPPPSTPPQAPPPPQTPTPQNPAPGSPIVPRVGIAPSRTKSPTVTDTDVATGAARARPQAQSAASARIVGTGSKTQKSTAPATAKSTSLPGGTIVTIGLGTCSGPDPYAKHPTLKGACVSGTWFPRVRKAEPRRQEE